MKLLVGGIVALLCVQTIHAFFASNNCERDLKKSRKQIKQWFAAFDEQHEIAHKDYLSIKSVCDALTAALEGFSAPGAVITECQIAEFMTAFFGLRLKAIESITHLRYYCDVLVDMLDEFRCGRNLVCNTDSTCSGCEAETNQLNCDLLAFSKTVTDASASAKQLLDGILAVCDILGPLARVFDCTNKPTCHRVGCSCGTAGGQSNANILANFNTFIAAFKGPHDLAHDDLVSLGVICNGLTDLIDQWRSTL